MFSPGAGWLKYFGFIHLTGLCGTIGVHLKDRQAKCFFPWAKGNAEHLALYHCDSRGFLAMYRKV